MAQDTSLRGSKSPRGGGKKSPEGAAAPPLPAPMPKMNTTANKISRGCTKIDI